MKKLLKICALVIFAFGMIFAGVGCKNSDAPTFESFEIKVGDTVLKTEYKLGEEVDLTNAKLYATYKLGKNKETLALTDFKIGEIDTTTAGYKNINVEFLGFKGTIQITVKSIPEGTIVDGVTEPLFLTNFKTNSSSSQFKVLNKNYVVGDDNNFKFFPSFSTTNTLTGEDSDDLLLYQMDVKVEIKEEGNSFIELTDDQYSQYVDSIDDFRGLFNFSSSAIGKTFKITTSINADELEDDREYDTTSCSIVIDVVDGWNAYTVQDLSRIDNSSGISTGSNITNAWDAYKLNYNITNSNDINGIILHNDIELDENNLPSTFFNANKTSLLERGCDIFTRILNADDKFGIYGNYYKLDFTGFPLLSDNSYTANPDDYIESHTRILTFFNKNDDVTGEALVRDLYLKGNGGRSEERENNINFSLQGFSTKTKLTTLENIVMLGFDTAITAEGSNSLMQEDGSFLRNTLNIQNCNMSDFFSNLAYLYGCGNVNVINSNLTNAGGPIINVIGIKSTNSNSIINIDSNSTISNEVVGTEGWFGVNFASSTATAIKSLSAYFASSGKSFTKELTNANGTVQKDSSGNTIYVVDFSYLIQTEGFNSSDADFRAVGEINTDTNMPLSISEVYYIKDNYLPATIDAIATEFNTLAIDDEYSETDKSTFANFIAELGITLKADGQTILETAIPTGDQTNIANAFIGYTDFAIINGTKYTAAQLLGCNVIATATEGDSVVFATKNGALYIGLDTALKTYTGNSATSEQIAGLLSGCDYVDLYNAQSLYGDNVLCVRLKLFSN